jgi:peptide/nickel transport system substrate-binding protein
MKRIALAAMTVFLLSAQARAQELTVGLAGAVTSMDPHFHNLSPNNGVAAHLFSSLVGQDEKLRLRPELAESWRALDDTTWEFKLRRGVRFHDGSPFEAEDVAATLRRIPAVPNSPSSFAIYSRAIQAVEIVDAHTIRFKTAAPYPLLPNDIANFNIVSSKQERAATSEFNSGTAANGTGPFRLVEFVPGDRIVLTRNEDYWGEKPHWARVTLRVVTNDSARVAMLLSGDAAIIDAVPPDNLARLRADSRLAVVEAASNRLIYLHLDSHREETPFARGANGEAIPNPLRDPRVRRALSMAINRAGIVRQVLEGAGTPAGGLLAEGFFGADPSLTPTPFDPEGARRLLSEAGYPNGFRLTIHGPNDRYVKDDQVLQAIGPMLTRIGIPTQVATVPWAAYAGQSNAPGFAYSVMLVGWGAGTGEVSSPLRALLATRDPARGMGAANRGRYSNPALDETLARALATVDDAAREGLLRQATRLAMADHAIVPLHYQLNLWGVRRGLVYVGRADEYTLAHDIRPAR